MLLSHKYKFIFIHVWKTGGTSVHKALLPYSDDVISTNNFFGRFSSMRKKIESKDFAKHITSAELQTKLDKKYFDNYYKFAFVRNPLSWEVSYYHFITQKPNNNPERETIIQLGSFDAYIEWAAEHEIHKHSQNQLLVDQSGEQLIDYVGKYENLDEEMHYLGSKLNLPRILMPHLNTSDHSTYEHYYTSRTEGIVREILKDDFALFGY